MPQDRKLTEGDRASLQAVLMAERGYAFAHDDQTAIELIRQAQAKLEDGWPACCDEVCALIRYLGGCGEELSKPAMSGSPT